MHEIEQLFAQRLKSARLERGLTLAEVASDTGLSTGYLSRLEGGSRQPSVGSLVILSRVLNINLTELLSDEPEVNSAVIRKGSRESHVRPEGDYVHVSKSLPNTRIDVVQVALAPDVPPVEMKSHPGEEWVYVLEGKVALELGTERYELYVGDAAHFFASLPHRMASVDGHAQVLLNIAGPSRAH